MEIKASIEELRQHRIFIGTPMYGAMCSGNYTKAIADLTGMCAAYQVEIVHYFLMNESLITRARAYIADEFMRWSATDKETGKISHLLFIDSDIGFNPQDALSLAILQTPESPYDIIAGGYPKKCIAWEKIKLAVEKGFADEDPNNLENYVGDFVFNAANNGPVRLDEPVQVMETGTGFMMIRRNTFEQFDKAYPQYRYNPDHVRSANFDGSRQITMYFDCEIDPISRRYLSEDYFFCYKTGAIGLKTYLCPWMRLVHTGSYNWNSSLIHLAQIGASATVDQDFLDKKATRAKGPKVATIGAPEQI